LPFCPLAPVLHDGPFMPEKGTFFFPTLRLPSSALPYLWPSHGCPSYTLPLSSHWRFFLLRRNPSFATRTSGQRRCTCDRLSLFPTALIFVLYNEDPSLFPCTTVFPAVSRIPDLDSLFARHPPLPKVKNKFFLYF